MDVVSGGVSLQLEVLFSKAKRFSKFGIQMLIGRLGSEMRGIGTQLCVEV